MTPDSARDDLAYLRALVRPDEGWQRGFGQGYAAAGGCYGVQFILHGMQSLGWISDHGPVSLLIGLGPTVVFLGLVAFIHRRGAPDGGGVTARAVGSVFGAVGLANVVAAAVVGSVALRQHSLSIWLIFPCIVMVFQGAAWMVAYTLRRRAWFALVGVGWSVAGVLAALCIPNNWLYLVVAGGAFLGFMLAPGVVMMRQMRAA